MQLITATKKYQDGISVFWSDAGTSAHDFFTYEELVDQRINALDLLNNPGFYWMDPASHKIESSVAACSFEQAGCEGDIILTRHFDASSELAWEVWTDPAFVMQWWGPNHFTSPSATIDLRVGGRYLFCMRSPEGRDYWSTGVYREVVRPERIVCTDSFADELGNVIPATHYGMSPDFPMEMLLTVTFEVQAGRTRFKLRHSGLPPGKENDLTRAGWSETLDKYAGVLARTAFGRRE